METFGEGIAFLSLPSCSSQEQLTALFYFTGFPFHLKPSNFRPVNLPRCTFPFINIAVATGYGELAKQILFIYHDLTPPLTPSSPTL